MELRVPASRSLLLYGSTAAEAHEAAHPPAEARVRNDLAGAPPPSGYLFRPGAAQAAAPKPFIGCDGHDGQPKYGWGRVVPAPGLPDTETSRAILTELATHKGVLAVMRRRGWFVPELGEMSPLDPPPKPGCIGYNVNHGQCIRLLLRSGAADLDSWRKTKASRCGYDGSGVLDVLYHELAHNVAFPGSDDHPPAFYALEKEIKDEAQQLAAWGDGAGSGRVLGGRRAGAQGVFEGFSEPSEGAAAQQEPGSAGSGGGARVLGGDTALQNSLPPEEARRLAALARQQAGSGGGAGGSSAGAAGQGGQ